MALILRCQKILFSAYRADQYADPEGFMTSLGAVLEQFPAEVIVYVTDPRTGIQRRSKWPPTISEVVEACEDHQDYLTRMRKPQRPKLPALSAPSFAERPAGALANTFIPHSNERYARLVEWSKTAEPIFWRFGKSTDGRDGIWVPWNIWDSGTPQGPAPAARPVSFELSDAALKTMRDLDAERNGQLPADQPEEHFV
ncbi:hypothetical protein [Bradyrhizobium sp. Arg816]|uniref:hypothetical protein n=1 Tax=Bradyrhizobium sp. Arg816 TaxID=2998491 RepID=UPI00249DD3CF|nr:hypothetical protein [Bradyrhizobium sp. Arg816]MDI3563540.1 hypothetical protein [Bradyrhizobium sp. Arg816]